jgi:chlorite dismutase
MKHSHALFITKTGHGHWRVAILHYGKEISAVTTNSMAIDDYHSDEMEKDGRVLRKLRGYRELREEVIRKNKSL